MGGEGGLGRNVRSPFFIKIEKHAYRGPDFTVKHGDIVESPGHAVPRLSQLDRPFLSPG